VADLVLVKGQVMALRRGRKNTGETRAFLTPACQRTSYGAARTSVAPAPGRPRRGQPYWRVHARAQGKKKRTTLEGTARTFFFFSAMLLSQVAPWVTS